MEDTQWVLVLDVAQQIKYSLFKRLSSNLRSMQKCLVYACFVDLKKSTTGYLEKRGSECCIDGHLLLDAKSLHSYSNVCVSVSGVISQQFTVGSRLWQGCMQSSSLYRFHMNWVRSYAAETTRVLLVEAARSINCSLRMIWCCFHLLNGAFSMHVDGFQLRATKLYWKLALKRPSYFVFLDM